MNFAETKNEIDPQGNDNPDTIVLIERAVQGEESAFRKIYELHSGKMYSLCQRYTGFSGDADDLFQESYLKVFKNLSTYKGAGSFEGWIRRIFVNTCLDHLKKKRTLVFTGHIEENEDLHPVTEGENSSKLQNDDLLKIIQQLPDGYRAIVNLYLVEGFNHREIAEMLNISEGTSKSQLAKAKAKLQEIILRYNEGKG
jgi:RNA polymerase sigma factor (sigma-70 family)